MFLKPHSASLLLTEDCNLRCTYCFEKDMRAKKIMSKETAKGAIDFLVSNALENGNDYFEVMFFGGEPLLALDIFEFCCDYGIEVSKKNNLLFRTSLITNGTIFNERVEKNLKKLVENGELNIQVSIDGIKENHDKHRIYENGNGSFDLIKSNIPKFKSVFPENNVAFTLHGCLTHETLPDFYESYLCFKDELGSKHSWFMPIADGGWEYNDVKIYEEQLKKIKDDIIADCEKNGDPTPLKDFTPLSNCFKADDYSKSPCGAGDSFVSFTASGEIFPCHHFYFNDPEKVTKFGDLENGLDYKKTYPYRHFDSNNFTCFEKNPNCDCHECYKCIADNFTRNGSIYSQDTGPRCGMSKVERKIQLELREYINMKQNEKKNKDCSCENKNTEIEELKKMIEILSEKIDFLVLKEVEKNEKNNS